METDETADRVAVEAVDREVGEDKVSVVVPTRGRPEHAVACVESILGCDDAHFDVTVVDQSDDDLTERELGRIDDERVHYLGTATRGAAIARNEGAFATDGPIIAFTDDDCRVDPGWVSELRAAFEPLPGLDRPVGMVFGSVVAPPVDDPTALAAQFVPDGPTIYETLPPVSEPWGISASVAVRRSVFEQVDGFDTKLGPGAEINTGGEDSDLFVRVLAARHVVVATDATQVTHLGFRSGDEAAQLFRGYANALGAVFAKHLRLHTHPGSDQLRKWLAHFAWQATRNAAHLRRPVGLGFVGGLARGALLGARMPLDRSTGKFA